MRVGLSIVIAIAMVGCVADTANEEEEIDSSEQEIAGPGRVRATQWNLASAGRYDPYPNCKSGKGNVTWGTAKNAARAVRENGILKTTGVFGLQDLGAPENGVAPTAVLASLFNGGGVTQESLKTDGPWGHVYFPHDKGIDTGLVYRQDLFRVVRPFGVFDVGGVNNSSFGKNAFKVAWGGALFEEKTTPEKKKFAVFTGKLVWNAEVTAGNGTPRLATETDRVVEVRKLHAHIQRELGGLPNITRIITVDLNTRARADNDKKQSAWEELHRLGYETSWRPSDVSLSPMSRYREFDQVFFDKASSGEVPRFVPFRTQGTCTPANPGPGGDHDIMSAVVKLR